MLLAITFSLVVASLVLHELGHAFWMRRYGIKLTAFGVGIPIPYLTLTFPVRGVPVRLSPLLLGAYVKTDDEEAMKALPWRHQADIYSAGPLMNFVFTGACVLALNLMSGRWLPMGIVVMGVGVAYFVIPRILSRYVVPALSLPTLALVALSIMRNPTEAVSGPVGMGQMAHKLVNSLPEAILMAGLLSFAIGMFNLLPLMPLDGGRTASALIRTRSERVAHVFEATTSLAIMLLVLYAFSTDILRLFR